jgi:hypothetical protein
MVKITIDEKNVFDHRDKNTPVADISVVYLICRIDIRPYVDQQTAQILVAHLSSKN